MKRKANSNMKRKHLIARAMLKDLCVAMVIDGRSDHCEVFNYKTAQKVPASQQLETLDKIYTELGAFEYLSQWEQNKEQAA